MFGDKDQVLNKPMKENLADEIEKATEELLAIKQEVKNKRAYIKSLENVLEQLDQVAGETSAPPGA